jgi:hypothetical protein
MKNKPKDITFHYTNEQMVKDLISITPINGSVLDAGSGKNKVWFNDLSGEKYECEIEDGEDFICKKYISCRINAGLEDIII